MKRIWLPLLALLGVVCIALGVYSLRRPQPASVQSPPVQRPSVQGPLVIYATDSKWHSLGTGPFSVEVTGGIDYGNGNNAGPNGSLKMGDSTALAEGLPFGSLIGKVGSGKPFLVGSNRTFTSNEEVKVAINDSYYGDNKGSYTVTKK